MHPNRHHDLENLAQKATEAWDPLTPPDDFAERVLTALDSEATPGVAPPASPHTEATNLSMLYRGPVLQAAVALALIGAAIAVALVLKSPEGEDSEHQPQRPHVSQNAPMEVQPKAEKQALERKVTKLPADLPQKIEAFIQSFGRHYGDTFEFHGTVLVARDGEVVFARGYGFADREQHRAHGPETIFPIGSLTQQFTATAVLQLAERKKLGLDDPVRMHLPELPESFDQVTLRQLLSHTAGLNNFTDLPEWIEHRAEPHTTEQLLARFTSQPPTMPGTEFEPTNSGYALLGAVIERVSKLPYGIYLQRNIFEPAGMRDSAYKDVQATSRAAHGYTLLDDDTLGAAPAIDLSAYGAAAGVVSTANDLLAWDRALYSEQLLSKAAIERMYIPTETDGYALGWVVEEVYNQKMVSHPGGVEGFNASILRLLDDRTLIVALANNDGVDCRDITTGVAQIVYGHKPTEPIEYEQGEPIAPAQLKRYTGLYTLSAASREKLAKSIDPTFLDQLASVNLEYKDGKMWMHIPVHGSHLMYPRKGHNHTFFFKDGPGTQAEFHDKPGEPAPWLTLKQGATEFVLKRVNDPHTRK